ncbi:MAG: hypothetical protein QM731_15905 [Chitinophagaceae bacterium]
MRKKTIWIIVIAVLAAGIGVWQYYKRKIVRDLVQEKIRSKTDSLYTIRYDSSDIDEVNGNVAFYKVRFGVDSSTLQKLRAQGNAPKIYARVTVESVEASGVDVVGLVKNRRFKAGHLKIAKPVIQIFQTDTLTDKELTLNDTVQLYRKILGQFDEIRADSIEIADGTALLQNLADTTYILGEGIDLRITQFVVDSTRNYDRISSYFVANTQLLFRQTTIHSTQQETILKNVVYNAPGQYATAESVYHSSKKNTPWTIDRVSIRNLNTNEFVYGHTLSADSVNIGRCSVSLKIEKQQKTVAKKAPLVLRLPTDIDKLVVKYFSIGPSDIKLDFPGKGASLIPLQQLVVQDINLSNNLTDVVSWLWQQQWRIRTGPITLPSNNKWYRFELGNLSYDHRSRKVDIDQFRIVPKYSEAEFMAKIPSQRDMFNITFSNIGIKNVQPEKWIDEEKLLADTVSLNANIKISRDKRIHGDSTSKVGNYPHQLLQRLPFGIQIKKMMLNNWYVGYKEISVKSEMPGIVSFYNMRGTASNITNIPEVLKINPAITIDIKADFLNKVPLQSTWVLPVTARDGKFSVSGKVGRINATELNQLIEPIAMASFKDGVVNSLEFAMQGWDSSATMQMTLLYDNIKMDMLKKGEGNDLDKQGFKSLLTNVLMRKSNPGTDGKIRSVEIKHPRDTNKSFFSLVWKTIFDGLKETSMKL